MTSWGGDDGRIKKVEEYVRIDVLKYFPEVPSTYQNFKERFPIKYGSISRMERANFS